VTDGFIHLHDEDYFDKTINCLSIPLKKILTNMLKYPLEYTTLANPKRIMTASSLAGIILQRISNDVFGGTMLPNLDICFQEMIDEGYLEKPTEKKYNKLCNL
jgi:Oxygen-sensitive ribonucleoside-triphosphate reductase